MSDWNGFKRGQNMIFAGGCPRSGTTLLQRVIGAHPDVFSDQEFQFLPSHILQLRQTMSESIEAGNIDRIVDDDSLDDAFRNFVASIFRKKLSENGATHFCEKTPSNALAIPELLTLFPDATFVLILRNPRDVVNSFKGVRQRYLSQSLRPPRFVRSTAASIEELNKYLSASLESARSDSRVLTIHYEDLVETPEDTVRKICDHTGLTFTRDMLDLDDRGANVPSRKKELWYSKQALNSGIRKKGVVTARNLLNETEKALVALYTLDFPELERYDLDPRAPGLLERLHWRISQFKKLGILLPRNRA